MIEIISTNKKGEGCHTNRITLEVPIRQVSTIIKVVNMLNNYEISQRRYKCFETLLKEVLDEL